MLSGPGNESLVDGASAAPELTLPTGEGAMVWQCTTATAYHETWIANLSSSDNDLVFTGMN